MSIRPCHRVFDRGSDGLPPEPCAAGYAGAIAAGSGDARPLLGRWSSRELMGDRREIDILHAGSVYRLRITALGKLILTK